MTNSGFFKRRSVHLAVALVLSISLPDTMVVARDGRDSDRTDRVTDNVDRDAARAAERAQRDEARYLEERAKIMEDAAKDPQRAAEEMAKLEEDRQEDLQKAAEDAAKDAADAAEDAADELAENHGMSGSSEGMRGVGDSENPDHDSRGYPVRRGEIVALDLSPKGLRQAQAQGYVVITREELSSLGGSLTRLAVPQPDRTRSGY